MPSSPSCSTSVGGTLRLRTSLLESVQRYHTEHLDSGTEKTTQDDNGRTSLLRLLVQRTPNVTNPSWAMEECGRVCPSAELWCGSTLPTEVWAPPATPDCPFGTTQADFRVHH